MSAMLFMAHTVSTEITLSVKYLLKRKFVYSFAYK
jgi:hypothetical protein